MKRNLKILSMLVTLPLALSACASGAADSAGADSGAGVEYGSSPEEFQEALEDMEPVTLTYQASAQSPNENMAWRDEAFAENVHEKSGGKITLDVVYAQAVAGYSEVMDALGDGRVDISYALPLYEPQRFPVNNAIVAATAAIDTSPLLGELVANAAMLEVAWNTPEVLDEYADNNLIPLVPINAAGSTFSACTEPGSDEDDWNGRQVRISSNMQDNQMQALGSTPLSMEHVETFEALQRGTVDCTLTSMTPAISAGTIDVADHISYPEVGGFSRGSGALLAGPAVAELPLAAQQLIFDETIEYFTHSRRSDLQSIVDAAQLTEEGVSFESLSESSNQILVEEAAGHIDEYGREAGIGEDLYDRVRDAGDRWTKVAEELGYSDDGGYADFNEWYSDDDVDFTDFSTRLYEEVFLPHRPQ